MQHTVLQSTGTYRRSGRDIRSNVGPLRTLAGLDGEHCGAYVGDGGAHDEDQLGGGRPQRGDERAHGWAHGLRGAGEGARGDGARPERQHDVGTGHPS